MKGPASTARDLGAVAGTVVSAGSEESPVTGHVVPRAKVTLLWPPAT